MKNYCFTKEEMQEIIKYFEFAIEQNIQVDKDDFIALITDDIDHDIWG